MLAKDIRHERNVLLQCLQYIVARNFFQPDDGEGGEGLPGSFSEGCVSPRGSQTTTQPHIQADVDLEEPTEAIEGGADVDEGQDEEAELEEEEEEEKEELEEEEEDEDADEEEDEAEDDNDEEVGRQDDALEDAE